MNPQRTIGGTGFTSLGDYVGANGDALDAQYDTDADQAHGVKDSYAASLGLIPASAEALGSQTGQIPDAPAGGLVPAYDTATSIENKIAPDLINTFAQRTGGGGGANPVSGEDSFDAALQKGAHGGDYSTLASSLGGTGVGSIQKGGAAQAWHNGGELGSEEYVPPTADIPAPTYGTPPGDQPGPGSGGSGNAGGYGGIGPGSTGGGQGGGVGGGGAAPPKDWRRPNEE